MTGKYQIIMTRKDQSMPIAEFEDSKNAIKFGQMILTFYSVMDRSNEVALNIKYLDGSD